MEEKLCIYIYKYFWLYSKYSTKLYTNVEFNTVQNLKVHFTQLQSKMLMLFSETKTVCSI